MQSPFHPIVGQHQSFKGTFMAFSKMAPNEIFAKFGEGDNSDYEQIIINNSFSQLILANYIRSTHSRRLSNSHDTNKH